ncbi:DUF6340 family protein [Costertonia aggregata]|uniref:Tetratricopeptide repeat protein n=1 Tax=Costertonia aggregata TaxID=343403 RepID=A0A7H9AU69_9FLAO|nr:DUF6340 family protein [Costertonia aggregata]QLG46745.1 hypothetical protein HYG79_15760 [Costertonia aggregata]
MKNLFRFLGLFTLMICLGACSATNRLTMGVTEPARIPLDSDITKIGIINRSIPSDGNKVVDEIDKILSLEGKNLDKDGAEAAITGLADELERGDRFEAIKIINDGELQRKGLGVFPAALPWETVEKICKENDVDILFSLEFYDTDTKANYEVSMVTLPNNLGINTKVPGHKVELNTVIKNGWRVYDPLGKVILDEYVSTDYLNSRGAGINPVKAVETIIGRKEGVQQLSNVSGADYALNTKPLRRRVSRDYFVRGTDNFIVAKRRAQTGDWNGAADLWENEIEHSKMKIAGRAHYNMAIINEINGDLEKAIEWASKAYSDYGNNMALRYVNILKSRMAQKRELNRQLSK